MIFACILLIASILLCGFAIVRSYRKYDAVNAYIYYSIGVLIIIALVILISKI